MSEHILTEDRINKLDNFSRQLLKLVKENKISESAAVSDLGHIYSAIDKRNETEIENCMDQFRDPFVLSESTLDGPDKL